MNECITATTCHFTPAASLAALGVVLEQRKVFEPIRAQVHIKQKTVKHTPHIKGVKAAKSTAHAVKRVHHNARKSTTHAHAGAMTAPKSRSGVN